MGGTRNMTAGKNYERELVNRWNKFGFTGDGGKFIPLFPTLGSTRQHSYAMDAAKVDLTTVDPRNLKNFGLLIQAKNTTQIPRYPKLLSEMGEARKIYGGIPVVYHKQTVRVQDTGDTPRFMKRGEFVTLTATDFEEIYTKKKVLENVYEKMMEYFDSFDPDIQKDFNQFLKEKNL